MEVLQDPFLFPNGDVEWASKVAGQIGMMEVAYKAGVGLEKHQQGLHSLHRKGDGVPSALSEETKCKALRERVLLSRPGLEIP